MTIFFRRTGVRSGSAEGLAAFYECIPYGKDGGGSKTTSSTNVTVVSIDQSIFGYCSSATYSEQDGFTLSEKVKPGATSIVVTNTNDSGEGSLRWAIDRTSGHVGADTVVFHMPDTDAGFHSDLGTWTIRPDSGFSC